MKASETSLLKFLKKANQFVIPLYQRNYAWTETQCNQLWDDLIRAGRSNDVKLHFIGSIVYVEQGLSAVTSHEPLLAIDGQQRLTTCTLLIAALAKHFESQKIGELLDQFSAQKLRNYYLLNPEESGERHFKLILSETDKDTMLAILQDIPTPKNKSIRIAENYSLFQNLIRGNQNDLEAICTGLSKLVIVDLSLDRTQDNPQLIFESMNSTGLGLSQADLIRNYILMGQGTEQQNMLYKNYWQPMEQNFGQEAYAEYFDAFMRHFLTAKTGEIPNIREVYDAFKKFEHGSQGNIQDLVADIHAYASYYCAMALGTESDAALKQAFQDLRELKVDVAYPFLLDVYNDYKQDRINSEEVLHIVRLVESYVFRRAVCDIPANSLNKTFASLSRTLKKDRYLESIQATLLLLPSYRHFPSDEEFKRKIKTRNLYNFRSRSYWLRRLENHDRKERVMVEDYTIEHIIPQNENLSKEWQDELGPDWKRIRDEWLNTLGNLTLTGYNSVYSDKPFSYKRDQALDKDGNLVGFAKSPLRLNVGLGSVAHWNEIAIQARADRLATKATEVWISPQLADDVLATYKIVTTKPDQKYSVSDHHHLVAGPMQKIFEELRKSILSLDPCVSEEFLKYYIAYKAESNFVDVLPKARRLSLVLNLNITDIEDPKGLCRDISSTGHWGNGRVGVDLMEMSGIPYIMGLIRQSFDYQMGNV